MLPPESNRFLKSLPRACRRDLISRSTHVELTMRQRISNAGAVPKSAYFILSGFASEVVELETGKTVEVGMVGFEGMTGSYHLLGPTASLSHCSIQMDGTALRLPFRELEKLFHSCIEVRKGVLNFIQHQTAHLAQTAACNRVHSPASRFARWLLTVHDRTREKEFFITQELLAQMLGTGRPTMNGIARSFERDGLIGHSRNRIRILNRKGLESVACACYNSTRKILNELYG
jgi:CRP-like cAMP-binding protein